jgi:hypothetical protein
MDHIDDAARSWRDLADQLTPEQIAYLDSYGQRGYLSVCEGGGRLESVSA